MDELGRYDNQEPEIPEIIIEDDDDEQFGETGTGQATVPPRNRWPRWLLAAFALLAAALLAVVGYHTWNRYFHIGIPISTSPSENIKKLQQPLRREMAEIKMKSDSILGVALDIYSIHGLRANLEMAEPNTADASVFLYCRSADINVDSTYLGSLVVDGEEKTSDLSRLGYMAMADGRQVIGVSQSDKVMDYVKERNGSFFRQFVLVSDGVIPNKFYLHGKVERKAIGRIGGRLYFVSTRHPETLWDFADALREYGFVDAIYITGGSDYCFYRTRYGVRHDIGSPKNHPDMKWKGMIPWLVFRNK